MGKDSKTGRGEFSNRFGVIAASAGSAIGLGNIWRFPYITGEYGGGAFLCVYLFFTVALGIPLVLSELVIGRKAKRDTFGAFKRLAPNSLWKFIGILGLFAAFFILAFYSVVAGWGLDYVFASVNNTFVSQSPGQLNDLFLIFIRDPYCPILFQVLFMVLTGTIVFFGIKNGIEKNVKIIMPLLFVLIIALDIRAVTLPGAKEGLNFLFNPDFSKLTAQGFMCALGQAFFSLSVGMGIFITYGSYIKDNENLINVSLSVPLADTIIAILAGVAIFPAVFAFGIEPGSGPGLIFITLPNIFQQMPGGYIFSIFFFLLFVLAALTSSISLLEVVVSFFDEELKMKRSVATILATSIITLLGMVCSLSLGLLDDYTFIGKNLFDSLDWVSSNLLMPLGGMAISIFVGWKLSKSMVKKELEKNGSIISSSFLSVFIFIVKYIAPVAILIIALYGVGLIKL